MFEHEILAQPIVLISSDCPKGPRVIVLARFVCLLM